MGFRFRKSKNILPGVRLTVSKSGVTTSIGRNGNRVTFGKKGTTRTVGIPGTGLSYSTTTKSKRGKNATSAPLLETNEGQGEATSGGGGSALIGLIVFAVICYWLYKVIF